MLAIDNIHDLEVALAASNRGSFSGAARELGITQPAVSQAVARLERQLGTTLFDRQESGHPAFLTDAGAVLLAHAIPALDELKEAVDDLAQLEGGRAMRVGMPSLLARHYFSDGLAPLIAAGQGHSVEIVLHDSELLIEELRLKRVDVGMVSSAELGVSVPHATFTKVASYPLTLAVRAQDLPEQSRLSIHGLARHRVPVVVFSGDRSLRVALSGRLAREGLELNVVAETDQLEMLYQLVLAGMGVGLSSGLALDGAPDGVAFTQATEEDLPGLNVFVFEDVARLHGPDHQALNAIRRQLFAAAHG